MTAILTLSGDQIISLFEQLEPHDKRLVLYKLAEVASKRRSERLAMAEARLREAAAKRELDWNAMGELERQEFVDDLVHEDR